MIFFAFIERHCAYWVDHCGGTYFRLRENDLITYNQNLVDESNLWNILHKVMLLKAFNRLYHFHRWIKKLKYDLVLYPRIVKENFSVVLFILVLYHCLLNRMIFNLLCLVDLSVRVIAVPPPPPQFPVVKTVCVAYCLITQISCQQSRRWDLLKSNLCSSSPVRNVTGNKTAHAWNKSSKWRPC